MKRLLTLLLFVVVFGAGSASCIFDDVEDPETAGAVFALVAIGLVFYCAKCVFQSADPSKENEITRRLTSELT
jgi:hypothetical protein